MTDFLNITHSLLKGRRRSFKEIKKEEKMRLPAHVTRKKKEKGDVLLSACTQKKKKEGELSKMPNFPHVTKSR